MLSVFCCLQVCQPEHSNIPHSFLVPNGRKKFGELSPLFLKVSDVPKIADRSRKKLSPSLDLKKLSGAFYEFTRFGHERKESGVSWGEFSWCQGWTEKQLSMGRLKNIVQCSLTGTYNVLIKLYFNFNLIKAWGLWQLCHCSNHKQTTNDLSALPQTYIEKWKHSL